VFFLIDLLRLFGIFCKKPGFLMRGGRKSTFRPESLDTAQELVPPNQPSISILNHLLGSKKGLYLGEKRLFSWFLKVIC